MRLLILALLGSCAIAEPAHPYREPVHPIEQVCTPQPLDGIFPYPPQDDPPKFLEMEASAEANGLEVGGCAYAVFIERFLNPPRGVHAPSYELGGKARSSLKRVRDYFGNVVWVTNYGVL